MTGLLICCSMLFPLAISAQSITAPLDPTHATRMPAATGWRQFEAVGLTYRESSGNREVNSEETHTFDTSAMTAHAQFKISNVALEAGWMQSSTEVTVDKESDLYVNLDYTRGLLHAALTGDDFVSVGLGGQELKMHDYIDSENRDEETVESSIIGSISVKMFEFLYLGGGYERVKEQSTYKVDNSWNNALLGLSILLGEPGGTRFRAEYSYASSPKSISEGQADKIEAEHYETEVSRYSVELMMSGLLFALNGSQERMHLEDSVVYEDESYEKITITNNEAGVLWIPENGVSLGFYFANSKESFVFEDDESEFRINLAYVFE